MTAILPAMGRASVAVGAAQSGATSGVGVELARLRKEYSACINCASADTEAGKRNIQQLDAKIKQLEARASAVQEKPPTDRVNATAVSTTSRIDVYA